MDVSKDGAQSKPRFKIEYYLIMKYAWDETC